MNKIQNFLMIFLVAFLVACESDPSDDLQDALSGSTVDDALAINGESQAVGTAAVFSNYDPANSVVPSAIDILFSGSEDGTLNIPITENDPQESVKTALNALDGFSTVTPISTGFTDSLDPATITADAVRMFEVTLTAAGGAVLAINGELEFGVDFLATLSSVDTSNSTLVVVPLNPLKPKTSYYIVITNSLKDMAGNSVGASPTYGLLKDRFATYADDNGASLLPNVPDESAATLELLRQLVSVSETVADVAFEDLAAVNIVMSWSFTTQSIGDVLTQVRDDIRAGDVPATFLVDSGTDSPAGGAADIWVGSLDVPYYLTAASGINDPTPLATFWQGIGGSLLSQFNTSPVATSTQTIPLMVSVPKSAMPTDGYPIVIYQHGITANRATMLAVADSLAAAGIAIAAIDMPLHGLTGNETDGSEAFYQAAGVGERTFDLDLVTQDPGTEAITALTPDGTTDTSGLHFINLQNLLAFRDNGRQAVSDLFTLTYAVENMAPGTSIFDSNRIYYVGHSAGAIVGNPFVALETGLKDAVIAHAGGYIMKTLDGSTQFSPVLVGGLAAAGILKGTPEYEAFNAAAQTVADTLDPLNYAAGLAARIEGILFFEIVGGNTSPSDLAVPITVPDANDLVTGTGPTVPSPMAGTEPLLSFLGLTQANSDTTGTNLKLSVKYVAGVHRSMFDPSTDPTVTFEMQTQMATFLASDGNLLDVTDDTLLQAPAP